MLLCFIQSLVEKHLRSISSAAEEPSTNILVEMFEVYLKLEILLHDKVSLIVMALR